MIPIIRANTPNGFNPLIHRVTKFKKNNYDGDYTLNKDNLFQYNGDNADYLYTEEALLTLSNMTVVEYEIK